MVTAVLVYDYIFSLVCGDEKERNPSLKERIATAFLGESCWKTLGSALFAKESENAELDEEANILRKGPCRALYYASTQFMTLSFRRATPKDETNLI